MNNVLRCETCKCSKIEMPVLFGHTVCICSQQVRNCDNPAPSNGGKVCTGDNMVLEVCTLGTCNTTGNSYSANYVSVSTDTC